MAMLLKSVAILCVISSSVANVSIIRGLELAEIQENCTPAAIHEFPNDGLTREQRRSGWIVLHILVTIYCFIALSVVCDDFFVPAIQTLVASLSLSEDVAGASFMAITSSSPELFINCIGTFITEGDIGIGTVVGSNVFNVLVAPSLCSLFANAAFKFERWSIMRDGLMYAIAVLMLIGILYDDKVYWYEAALLVLAYVLYITVMYFSKSVQRCLSKCNGRQSETKTAKYKLELSLINNVDIQEEPKEESGVACWRIIFCPMRYTIPTNKKLYLLTLLMCMVWIGAFSYLLAWSMTAVGDTIGIPDSVMGLSFIAVGSSMPEIVSLVIVSRGGQGILGMSSALGANTFEVLLCLGLPWLIKTGMNTKTTGKAWIKINSSGLSYNAACLLSSLLFLYICLIVNKLRIDKRIGILCLAMYGVFLIVGSLIELNVFFPVNLPTCQ